MRTGLIAMLLSACLTIPMWGQSSATASVPISLRIPGSITLSLRAVPVEVSVSQGMQRTFAVPLSLTWNLDPREVPAFRVVAYFLDAQAALFNRETVTAITPDKTALRWNSGEFRRFRPDGTLTLFRTNILAGARRGQRQDALEFKISDEFVPILPNGSYEGVLYLEVRHY